MDGWWIIYVTALRASPVKAQPISEKSIQKQGAGYLFVQKRHVGKWMK